MKRLCVFHRLADRFLGNKKIEWIVCKECQRLLIRGVTPKVVWQKVHKHKTVVERSESEWLHYRLYGCWPKRKTSRAKHTDNPPNTQMVELGMAGRF